MALYVQIHLENIFRRKVFDVGVLNVRKEFEQYVLMTELT